MLVLALGAAGAAAAGAAAAVHAAPADAPPCLACHADVQHRHAAHPVAPEPGGPDCSACHRDAHRHPGASPAEDPMMRFAAEPASARSDVCLSCHVEAHPMPGAGVHERAGVACDDCHSVHEPVLADGLARGVPLPAGLGDLDAASATCLGCHQGVFTEFAFNERHRLEEGVLDCVSCHDPHQTRPSNRLAHVTGSACGDCHVAQTGPFVFEHAASVVDGCVACHEPHGSPNRFLLTHQSEGALCHTCHAVVPQFHIGFVPGAPPRFDQETVCSNCHTAIHGSNFDRNFLR
jgi:DmsE family decaheme c-type cytochrome